MSCSPSHPHTIESRTDLSIRRIRRLQVRDERDRTGRYYIEGLRFVFQALQRHARIETVVVCRPLLALCDVMVRIPMVGRADSLNLGVATSIMLYELFNQRRERPPALPPGTVQRPTVYAE